MPRKPRAPRPDLDAVRDHIRRDKQTAIEVIDLARERSDESVINLGEDITGSPELARSFNRRMGEQRIAIEAVRRDLYFRKIEAAVQHGKGEVENHTYLVTKQRIGGELLGDGWTVVSWTAPITARLLDRSVGAVIRFQADRGTPIVRFEIHANAKYGTILPELLETTYFLSSGQVYVEHEQQLATEAEADGDMVKCCGWHHDQAADFLTPSAN